MQPFVIHTHFYQPERANPWTGTLDPEDSAAPFRDWNERIHRECYRANAFARIFDGDDRIRRIVNTYEHLSFNFGPTLLAWLEHRQPATYERILEADRHSRARTGHGNALAQSFHHTILPLDTDRDRRTQIRWGLTDFRHRFGREPEGMWLPETAASQAVVDALVDEGVAFTVLAPRQAARIREPGAEWRDTNGDLDTSRPYRIPHSDGSGRSLAAFFYDGGLAQRLAFDPKTMDSGVMIDALAAAVAGGLVHAALDGETFGHHHRFGELGLAYTLVEAALQRGLEPTGYGAYLAAHPPDSDAELLAGEGSSWSCAHGVGRWTRDCGCSTNAEEGWNQAWRRPLRAALDVVRDAAAAAFADLGSELLRDPERARDAYAEVLVGATDRSTFLDRHAVRPLDERERTRVWSLLEAQRNAMAMYTSCGWFFADVSGLETIYVMRFAARAMELLAAVGAPVDREAVLERLGQAESNRTDIGTGADVWRTSVEPSAVTHARVAAQVAMRAAAELRPDGHADGHGVQAELTRHRWGAATLATGTARVTAEATERTEAFTVAALGVDGLDLQARVTTHDAAVQAALNDLADPRGNADPERLAAELERLVGGRVHGPDDMLPSSRSELVDTERSRALQGLRREVAGVHDRYARRLELLRAAGTTLPADVRLLDRVRADDALDRLLTGLDRNPGRLVDALDMLAGARRAGHDLEFSRLRRALGEVVTARVLAATPALTRAAVDEIATLLHAADRLELDLELSAAQEAVYELATRPANRQQPSASPELVAHLGELLGLAPVTWRG